MFVSYTTKKEGYNYAKNIQKNLGEKESGQSDQQTADKYWL
jgi:hypothetical protein